MQSLGAPTGCPLISVVCVVYAECARSKFQIDLLKEDFAFLGTLRPFWDVKGDCLHIFLACSSSKAWRWFILRAVL